MMIRVCGMVLGILGRSDNSHDEGSGSSELDVRGIDSNANGVYGLTN